MRTTPQPQINFNMQLPVEMYHQMAERARRESLSKKKIVLLALARFFNSDHQPARTN